MKASTGIKALVSLLAILMFTFTPDARARVYKCKLPNGQTEYKDKPCSGASQDVEIYSSDTVTKAEYDAAAQARQRSKAHVSQRVSYSSRSAGSRMSNMGSSSAGRGRRTCR